MRTTCENLFRYSREVAFQSLLRGLTFYLLLPELPCFTSPQRRYPRVHDCKLGAVAVALLGIMQDPALLEDEEFTDALRVSFGQIPLVVLLGTEWPLFSMLQSAPFAERFSDDPVLHCLDAPQKSSFFYWAAWHKVKETTRRSTCPMEK